MSLIQIIENEITNSRYNMGKAVPKANFDMPREVNLARHLDGCSDLMQRHYPTEELLILGNKRKRGRRSYKPFFPVKEVVRTSKVKIPNYIGFSCRHFAMYGMLRYGIDASFVRMFK